EAVHGLGVGGAALQHAADALRAAVLRVGPPRLHVWPPLPNSKAQSRVGGVLHLRHRTPPWHAQSYALVSSAPMPGVQVRQLLLRGPKPGNARWEVAWQGLIVLVAAGLVYWPFLGHSGFAFSEGQRVFPGWEMARGGDWLVPRLFGQAYLRKPPGMPWAIALASFVFGENEFSARSVSALAVTLGALISF